MEENIKEKSIILAIEAMRPLPVNSFAGYCSVSDDRSPGYTPVIGDKGRIPLEASYT